MAPEQRDTSEPTGAGGGADGAFGGGPNGASSGDLDQRCESTSDSPKRIHMFAVAALAESQFGRITWAQLRHLGVAEATINHWVNSGYLAPLMRSVYAVGHVATSKESSLFEAVLFAGPGACLSHGTAAWWRGLLNWPVADIHVSTPRKVRSPGGDLTIHCRRTLEREVVNGIPVTTLTQTMLDLAASESLKLVRHALAQLDYMGGFALADLYSACGNGRRGSAALACALRDHQPELARTRSELEVRFLLLCERYEIPMPLMNRKIYGFEADAWWPDFNLVVELDGNANHRTPAQRNKDLQKELRLREHGIAVLRYDYHLTTRTPSKISDDLLSQMRGPRSPARSSNYPITD